MTGGFASGGARSVENIFWQRASGMSCAATSAEKHRRFKTSGNLTRGQEKITTGPDLSGHGDNIHLIPQGFYKGIFTCGQKLYELTVFCKVTAFLVLNYILSDNTHLTLSSLQTLIITDDM